jgi:hypothetical protein
MASHSSEVVSEGAFGGIMLINVLMWRFVALSFFNIKE